MFTPACMFSQISIVCLVGAQSRSLFAVCKVRNRVLSDAFRPIREYHSNLERLLILSIWSGVMMLPKCLLHVGNTDNMSTQAWHLFASFS